MLNRRVIILSTLAALVSTRRAVGQEVPDLKKAPASRKAAKVEYCHGVYRIAFQDGKEQRVMEFNLRLKTDTGPRGPLPGTPVLLPAGMRGDRFFLVFSAPEEISRLVQRTC